MCNGEKEFLENFLPGYKKIIPINNQFLHFFS